MGLAILPLLLLLLALPLVVFLVLAVVRACTLPRGMGKRPGCGACGYEHTGWTTCPECGGAVGDVGIVTPRLALKLRGNLAIAAIGLLVLAATGGGIVGGIGQAIFDSMGYVHRMAIVQYSPERAPGPTLLNYEVLANVSVEYARGEPVGGEIVLAIEPDSAKTARGIPWGAWALAYGRAHAIIDASTGSARLVDSNGAPTQGAGVFDRARAETLFGLAGLDTSRPDVSRSIDDAVSRVNEMRRDRGQSAYFTKASPITPGALGIQNSARGASATSSPLRILGLSGGASWWMIVFAMTLFAYGFFLRWIVRRRRRLLAPLYDERAV